MNMNKKLPGSLTIEMAVIVPVILSVFFLSVMGIFYFHDKDLISSCAYETAVTAGLKAREKEGVTPGQVQMLFLERIRGKCILFSNISTDVEVTRSQVRVTAMAEKGRMKMRITQTAPITEPEKKIRMKRILDDRIGL